MYMIGSLQNFCSSQGHDGVIEEEIESFDDDDEASTVGESSWLETTDGEPTARSVLPAIVAAPVPLETRTYEYKHTFETSTSIGIKFVDKAAADSNKESSNSKKKKKKKSSKSKNAPKEDDAIGLFVGSLVDYGQADQLNRMMLTISKKKHLDKEILVGDKVIQVSGVDVSRCSGKEFVQIVRAKGETGKKPVELKFRGTRVVKIRSSPTTKGNIKNNTKKKSKNDPRPPASESSGGSSGRKRRKLVHRKGSLGGGKSERGGRIRQHDINTTVAAEAAIQGAEIRPSTSMKAKSLAATFVSTSVRNRKQIVKGDDLIKRISFHLNAVTSLLDTPGTVGTFLRLTSQEESATKHDCAPYMYWTRLTFF